MSASKACIDFTIANSRGSRN